MAEVNTAELDKKVEAAFGLGFDDTPPAPVAKVVETPTPKPAEPVAVAAVVPKPEYVRVTKQERDNDKAAIGKIAALESALAKLSGSMPKTEQIIQQVIEKVQSQTPIGLNVEMSDQDFAELAADFPDIAKMSRVALERIFKKANIRGTGAPATVDEGTIAKAVETVLTGREKQALEKTHPTWKEIVGAVDVNAGQKPPENNPFRKWLGAQPADYQKEINGTQSPAVVQSAIDRFVASQKAPGTPVKPDRADARRAVIADAVTPRAEGSPPPPTPRESAEDAFGKAFKARKRY